MDLEKILWPSLIVGSLTLVATKAIPSLVALTSRTHSYTTTARLDGGRAAREALLESEPNSVIHKQKYFLNKDSLYIFWQTWNPVGPCKGVVVIVHGLNEHSHRYHHLALNYSSKGFKVYALDHQGHGMSEGDRMFVAKLSDYIDDVVELVKRAKAENPSQKLILLGHSMGGLIAVRTTLKIQNLLDGAIYSAPALYVERDWKVKTLPLLASLLPKARVEGLDISTLCHDAAVVDAYVNDPLVSSEFPTVNLQNEILKGIDNATERFSQIKLPILLIHGTADELCPIRGSEALAAAVSSEDKTFRIFEGAYHELFNEPNSDEVIQETLKFLERIALK